MSLLQLLPVAIVAMVGLAGLRVVRVHLGRTPLPDGRGRRLFLAAFVIGPPMILTALLRPGTPAGLLTGITSVPAYVLFVTALAILMAIAAVVIGRLVHSPSGRLARLALAGWEDDPVADIPANPPITRKLAACVADVERANTAFPRGSAFPTQIHRTGFRADWDTLDDACAALERSVASERLLAVGVATKAEATATDARSRLDTLRRIALQDGQAWAGQPAA